MKTRNLFLYIIAIVIVLATFSVIYLFVFYTVPESNKDALNIVLGALMGGFSLVLGYFFGSSKGSADKQEIMANGSYPK